MLGDFHQSLITRQMPHRIVDFLKIIHIQYKKCVLLIDILKEGFFDKFLCRHFVEKPGKQILMCLGS